MTQFAAGYRILKDDGRERRSDGLLKHVGLADLGSIRSMDNLTANVAQGAGLELLYVKSTSDGYVQVYDRTNQAFGDLHIQGKNISMTPVGGSLSLPASCVGTAQIQANAVTQLLGTYRQVSNWTVPGPNTWYESPAQVTATTTGGRIRLDASGALTSNTAGAGVYVGVMTDGSVTFDSLTAATIAGVGYAVPFAFTCYCTPLGAMHRFAIALYSPTATPSGLWGGGYTDLWVTEERR